MTDAEKEAAARSAENARLGYNLLDPTPRIPTLSAMLLNQAQTIEQLLAYNQELEEQIASLTPGSTP